MDKNTNNNSKNPFQLSRILSQEKPIEQLAQEVKGLTEEEVIYKVVEHRQQNDKASALRSVAPLQEEHSSVQQRLKGATSDEQRAVYFSQLRELEGKIKPLLKVIHGDPLARLRQEHFESQERKRLDREAEARSTAREQEIAKKEWEHQQTLQQEQATRWRRQVENQFAQERRALEARKGRLSKRYT